MEKGLGYFPGRHDDRDEPLLTHVRTLRKPQFTGSRFWQNRLRLDQGREGACVGFGFVQGYNSSPVPHNYSNAYAQDVYRNATYHDDWPNVDWRNSSGTSVRAGAEEMLKRGLINAYAFSYDVEEVAMWIMNKNPVVIGVDWYEGMYEAVTENRFYITPTGRKTGGHCTLLDGVRWNKDEKDYFRGLNSWGSGWGDHGRFKLSVDDLHKLLQAPGGVACTWVEHRL